MLQAREGLYLHKVIDIDPPLDDEDYVAGWGIPRSEVLGEISLEDIEDSGKSNILYY